MYEKLYQYISSKVDISQEEFEFIKSGFVYKKLRKKQYLLQEGELATFGAFIIKGCLRMYRIGEKGEEIIQEIGIENWWISDKESMVKKKPSIYYIDALENSDVLLFTIEKHDELVDTSPPFRKLLLINQKQNLIAIQQRLDSTLSYSAEKKYQQFMDKYPEIILRVPQHMIASYLGFTGETLSRIRRKMTNK